MKAARLYEYDEQMNVELKVETRPDPEITQSDEVIIRVGAAGLCRTDLHIIEGVWKDIQDPQRTLLPYILGHENAGWVEEVGSSVRSSACTAKICTARTAAFPASIAMAALPIIC
jgi:NAD+-dependent secondary alcohol dehydrogenase Adh1